MKFATLAALTLSAALVGCAAKPFDQARHHCDRAEIRLCEEAYVRAIKEGDRVGAAYNNLGVLQYRRGEHQSAIQLYTMGARYDEPMAISNLLALGADIPEPDLAHTQAVQNGVQSGSDATNTAGLLLYLLNSGIQGYNQGTAQALQNRNANRPVTCNSKYNDFDNSATTTCR